MRAFSSLAAAALLGSAASAQFDVVINEVLYDPSGPDAGLERIEIKNNDMQEANLSGYALAICYPGSLLDNRTYWPFGPNFKIPPGEAVTIHYLEDGLDTLTDFYTGASGGQFICVIPPKNLHNDIGSLAIYDTTNCSLFSSFSNIIDFVQWGAPTHHEVQAQVAGIWTAGTWLEDIDEGRVFAYDGDGDTLDDWWTDVSPTFGLYNESPGNPYTVPFGMGCDGVFGTPVLETTGGPPALGNVTFAMKITGGLPGSPAAVAVASNPGTFPIFGCTIELDPTALMFTLPTVTLDGAGVGTFPLPVVDDPNLLGVPVYFQGGVIDPGPPNGPVAFTNGILIVI